MSFRWPVSARAYALVIDELSRQREERERLLMTIERLTDQLVRVQRFAVGMTEAPREPRKVDPMPDRVRQIIMAVGDSRIRAVQTRGAWRRYAELGSWEAVEDELVTYNVEDREE